MGNHKSRPSTVHAFLDYACDVAIRANSTCLSAAQARIAIEINKARDVTFRDVTLESQANAAVGMCRQDITVDLPSMHANVDAAITALAATHVPRKGDVTVLQTAVKQAMTATTVKLAMTSALAAYTLRVREVDGATSVANFNVHQSATATLVEAIQNTQVSSSQSSQITQPLADVVADVLARQPSCPAEFERNAALAALAMTAATTVFVIAKKL